MQNLEQNTEDQQPSRRTSEWNRLQKRNLNSFDRRLNNENLSRSKVSSDDDETTRIIWQVTSHINMRFMFYSMKKKVHNIFVYSDILNNFDTYHKDKVDNK